MTHGHGSHAHAHPHGHDAARGEDLGTSARRALGWALALNAAFLVVEVVVGLWSGSLALLSDAAHMLSDVGALALALWAAHLARRPPQPNRTFGYRRAEVLGGFVNGLVLVGGSILIVKTAIERLTGAPAEILGGPVLVAGLIGLAINLGSAWFLARSADRRNVNIRGALLHMLADALGSVGAVAAAVLIMAGYPAADAWISLVTVSLVLAGTWHLLRDASRILLGFAPPHADSEEVREALLAIDGVDEVHELHLWSVDGTRTVLSAHVVGAEDVRPRAEDVLRDRFGIDHTTLQVETDVRCAEPDCSLWEIAAPPAPKTKKARRTS